MQKKNVCSSSLFIIWLKLILKLLLCQAYKNMKWMPWHSEINYKSSQSSRLNYHAFFQFVEVDPTLQNIEPRSTPETVNDNSCASLMHNGCESTNGSDNVITSESQMNQIMPSVPFCGSRSYSDTQTMSLSQNHNGYINYNYDPPPPYDWIDYTRPEVRQTEESLPVQYISYEPKCKYSGCSLQAFGISCGICFLTFCFIANCFL